MCIRERVNALRDGAHLFRLSLLLIVYLILSTVPCFAYANSLSDGNTIPNNINLIAQDSKLPVDFVFMVDSTGSMDKYINSVRSNLSSFASHLDSNGVDIRMSLIDFRDVINNQDDCFALHSFSNGYWTNNPKEISDELSRISTRGGGDSPETPSFAIATMGGLFMQDESWSNANGWRRNARRFVFLLTDAGFHDGFEVDGTEYNMYEIITSLIKEDIHVTVVGNTSYQHDYGELYSRTSGKFIDISQSNYYKLMLDAANWVFEVLSDTDGDGLPDEWEINGVDVEVEGEQYHLDLKAMGANPLRKDLFVEIDWMYKEPWIYSTPIGDITLRKEKSLQPNNNMLRILYEAFANASDVTNPDGTTGISLHVDAGPESIDYANGNRRWGSLSGGGSIPWEDSTDNLNLNGNKRGWNELVERNFHKSRWKVFRHAAFLNETSECTGLLGIASFIPGQCILTFDNNGTFKNYGISEDEAKASNFMHELGHTLGLRHGGNEDLNMKPNYFSIMNYLYSTRGLKDSSGKAIIDYSRYELDGIDEEHVNELKGFDENAITQDRGLAARWKKNILGQGVTFRTDDSIAGAWIDFNFNTSEDKSISYDFFTTLGETNFLGQFKNVEEKKIKKSQNDWKTISFRGGYIDGTAAGLNFDELIVPEENIEGLLEPTIDEMAINGMLGDDDECSIGEIGPEILYEGIDNQKLTLTINNLGVEETNPMITVKSELVMGGTWAQKVHLDKTSDSMVSKALEIPIISSPIAGSYEVTVVLKQEDGMLVKSSKTMNIVTPRVIDISIGESVRLFGDDGNDCPYSNVQVIGEAAAINDEGIVTGVSTGVALIRLTNADGTVEYLVVNIKDSVSAGVCGSCQWTLSGNGILTIGPGTLADPGSVQTWPWSDYASQIKTVRLTGRVRATNSLAKMFYGCNELESLDLSNLDTSGVTSLYYMLALCSSLRSVNLTGFNTSSVTNMRGLFSHCSALESLDLSGFNTSSVTNMYAMFDGCLSLVNVSVAGFDTSHVTDMWGMFSWCSSLRSIDVSNWDVRNVTRMGMMFGWCKSLESLDLSRWQTPSLWYLDRMFASCTSLRELDVSGIDVSDADVIEGAFENCSALQSLDLSSWRTASVLAMGSLFDGCTSLRTVDLSGFDTARVSDATVGGKRVYGSNRMFAGCTNLKSIIVGTGFQIKDTAMFPEATAANGKWWSKADQRWYTKDEIVASRSGVADTYTATEDTAPAPSTKDGWVNLAGGGKGYAKNGKLVEGWMDLGSSKYYFGDDHAMLLGWNDVVVDGKVMHYYFNPASGNLVRGTWFTIEGTNYYFRPSGNLATGWATIKDNGVDKKYYFREDGSLVKDTWYDIDNGQGSVGHYYFRPSGSMATEWATIDGQKYFFRPSGNMATGWADVTNDGGATAKHYFDADGVMLVGWQQIGGNTYYFRPSGAMQTGTTTIDGKACTFSDKGVLVS